VLNLYLSNLSTLSSKEGIGEDANLGVAAVVGTTASMGWRYRRHGRQCTTLVGLYTYAVQA
jgi:hypothetical protein